MAYSGLERKKSEWSFSKLHKDFSLQFSICYTPTLLVLILKKYLKKTRYIHETFLIMYWILLRIECILHSICLVVVAASESTIRWAVVFESRFLNSQKLKKTGTDFIFRCSISSSIFRTI